MPLNETNIGVKPPNRSAGAKILKWVLIVIAALLAALVIFLLIPAPIEPAVWVAPTPPSFDSEGPWKENNLLSTAELVTNTPRYPEFITFDSTGQLFTGDSDGKIYKVPFDANGVAGEAQLFADTQGTPNGLKFDANGHLLVADVQKGLLSVDQSGSIELLTNEVDGGPIYLANELDVDNDGIVYFTDTSNYGRVTFREIAENKPHGRLLKYDPATKQTSVLLDGLYFANGVALSQSQDFLLVVETYRYQITKYWIKGSKAGTSEVIATNLAGFADNITTDENGNFWIGIFTTRLPFADQMHANPFLARTMSKVPQSLLEGASAPAKHGLLIQMDPVGTILGSWHDPQGKIYGVTTAVNHNGYIYMGTAPGGSNGVYRVPLDPK